MKPIPQKTLPAIALAGIASLAAGPPGNAHHGGGIEYERQAEGPVSGVVTEFAFRFPHVQIYMDVTDGNGNVESWAMITRWTPTVLRQHGWTRNSVVAGDVVTVTYLPHVSAPQVGNMLSIQVNGEPLALDFEQ